MKLSKFIPRRIREQLWAGREAARIVRNMPFVMKADALTEKAINCTSPGVSNKHYGNELIVSLTTYSHRLYNVHLAIESIMQGTVLPNRIILWLGEEMREIPLPVVLQNQMKRGLEITFCKDIRAYTKLVPTLCKYPSADVITIDDDLIYNYDLVESLLNAHNAYGDCIVARRIHKIVLGEDDQPLPYARWDWGHGYNAPTHLNFFTGVGGVYYPSGCLDKEVYNEKVFTEICQYADDIWFNAMALKKGTKVMRVRSFNPQGEDYLMNMSVQNIALCLINNGQSLNDIQLKAVFERYGLYPLLREERQRIANRDYSSHI